jgi:putative endonuclease
LGIAESRSKNPTLSANLRQTLATLAASVGKPRHRAFREGYPPKPASEASDLGEGGHFKTVYTVTPTGCLTPASRDVHWRAACSVRVVPYPAKRFLYIIRSLSHPQERYVGVSADVAARVSAHNAGQNRSTEPWRPWGVDITIEFRTERMALRFEK